MDIDDGLAMTCKEEADFRTALRSGPPPHVTDGQAWRLLATLDAARQGIEARHDWSCWDQLDEWAPSTPQSGCICKDCGAVRERPTFSPMTLRSQVEALAFHDDMAKDPSDNRAIYLSDLWSLLR